MTEEELDRKAVEIVGKENFDRLSDQARHAFRRVILVALETLKPGDPAERSFEENVRQIREGIERIDAKLAESSMRLAEVDAWLDRKLEEFLDKRRK